MKAESQCNSASASAPGEAASSWQNPSFSQPLFVPHKGRKPRSNFIPDLHKTLAPLALRQIQFRPRTELDHPEPLAAGQLAPLTRRTNDMTRNSPAHLPNNKPVPRLLSPNHKQIIRFVN